MISNPAVARPNATLNPSRRLWVALAILALAIFGCMTAADAATWVVNSTGTGDDFPNIQAAIASSLVVNGDTIVLEDGTYTGPGNRDIVTRPERGSP